MSDESDSDEGEDLFVGLSRPTLNTDAGNDDDEEDDDEEGDAVGEGAVDVEGKQTEPPAAVSMPAADEQTLDEPDESRLVGADEAFEDGAAPSELDPFRVAAGADVVAAGPSDQPNNKMKQKQAWVPRNHISQRKLFVGGVPYSMNDTSFLKFFSRYGKVQEATVAVTDGGKPRGFGFVTFVSDKGSRYCLQQAGDPPKIEIEGRECTVRPVEDRSVEGEGHYLMPARGDRSHLGPSKRAIEAQKRQEERSSGTSSTGAPFKRGAEEEEMEGGDGDEVRHRRVRKKKEEIVTVTRRQDAEPLNKRPITMKEIFPKEFWRV